MEKPKHCGNLADLRLNGVFSKAKERNPTSSFVERGKFRPALDQVRAELAWFHLELIKFQRPRIKFQGERIKFRPALDKFQRSRIKFQAELGSSQPELDRFPLELGATRLGKRPSQPRNTRKPPLVVLLFSPQNPASRARA